MASLLLHAYLAGGSQGSCAKQILSYTFKIISFFPKTLRDIPGRTSASIPLVHPSSFNLEIGMSEIFCRQPYLVTRDCPLPGTRLRS